MDAIVAMIGRLVHGNSAYAAEGHVLFDTQAFTDYGKLSGRPLDEMIVGARVEVAPYKQHPADFVLWKPSKPGEPVWESPFGPGRPGWHIECSAMIEQELGLPIDIHGGGIDLVFPHHENELAQGMCDGHRHETYANYWLHNGFLNMADEKMSKSVGNVALAHDLLKTQPGEVIRWALLGAHYRQPLAWTDDALAQARKPRWTTSTARWAARGTSRPAAAGLARGGPAQEPLLDDPQHRPPAMALLKKLATDLDTAVRKDRLDGAGDQAGPDGAGRGHGFPAGRPAGSGLQGAAPSEGLNARIDGLIAARDAARIAKDWAEADRIRAELTALNVEVMDGPAERDLAHPGAGLMPLYNRRQPCSCRPLRGARGGLRARARSRPTPSFAAAQGPAGPAGSNTASASRPPAEVIWEGDLRPARPGEGGTSSIPRPSGENPHRPAVHADLTLALPGQAPQQIRPTVMEWVPDEQLHWKLRHAGRAWCKTIRYFEIEALAEAELHRLQRRDHRRLAGPEARQAHVANHLPRPSSR